MYEIVNPTKVIFGVGSLDILGKKAAEYGKKAFVVSGKNFIERTGLMNRIKVILNQNNLEYFRKFYPMSVDEGKCIKCELCVKLCPIDNIGMDEYPVIGGRCLLCMRCVSFCPSGAIAKKNGRSNNYRALKASDMLKP